MKLFQLKLKNHSKCKKLMIALSDIGIPSCQIVAKPGVYVSRNNEITQIKDILIQHGFTAKIRETVMPAKDMPESFVQQVNEQLGKRTVFGFCAENREDEFENLVPQSPEL